MIISPMQGTVTPSQLLIYGMPKYGVRIDYSTGTVTRLGDAVGKIANIYPGYNDFDNIMPWAGMRRCNRTDDTKIQAYYGDTTYKEDGSNGQVMDEVPGFYYSRHWVNTNIEEIWISMFPLSGFKYHPWFYDVNGLPLNKNYFSAYEGCVYDVSTPVAEVDTLTVTAGCATSGNITINLDGMTNYTVAVNAGDATTAVATKIGAVAYTGWTASVSGAVVTFTCNTTGAKNTLTFTDTQTTGVTSTITKTTSGAGGYTTGDAQIADFTASTGDKLASIAGVKPCSGLVQNLTLPMSRILATNRGAGWQQQYFNAVSAIQMLMVIEYANLNTQVAIGQGAVNIADDGTTNKSIITGGTSYLGNKSGRAVGTDGLVSISYRGIENFWGNIWKWVDGFNIKDGFAYISNINGNFVSDKFDGQYIKVGELAHVNGYMSKALLNYNFDWGFVPAEALGTSSSKYADYYYQNSVGAFVALLGGAWLGGAVTGAFYWYLINGSASRGRYFGARLCA